jgi:hypothetical protein
MGHIYNKQIIHFYLKTKHHQQKYTLNQPYTPEQQQQRSSNPEQAAAAARNTIEKT